MKPLTVLVSEADIEEGTRGSCHMCPIALALGDMGLERISVGETVAHWYDRKTDTYYGAELPPEARDFICNFDTYLAVSPFSFTIPENDIWINHHP